MASSSAQLQHKAEQARERLAERVEDLRHHLLPSVVIDDLLGAGGRLWNGDEFLPALLRQARENPLAYALIAVGLGWLVYAETRAPSRPGTARKRRSAGRRRTRRARSASQAMPARRKPSI
jgi:hypothetical protein